MKLHYLPTVRTGCVIAALLTIVGGVSAQFAGYYNGPYNRSPYGYRYYGTGYASTPAQAYAYGMAEAVRAQGAYNVMTAEAAKRAEEARRLDLDNRVKATQTFFELRKINREQTEAENAARKARSQSSAERLATSRRPGLSVTQLDPVTGAITWPSLLLDDRFAARRKAIESMFLARAEGHAVSPTQIQSAIDALRADLDTQFGSAVTQDYALSVSFLRLLGEEARTLSGTQVASR